MSNCKHEIVQEQCAVCNKNAVKKDIYFEPELISKNNNNEQYGLALSDTETTGTINVMWRSENNHFERISKEDTNTYYVVKQQIMSKKNYKSSK